MTWTAPEPFPRPTKERRAFGTSKPKDEPRTPLKHESKKQRHRRGELKAIREAILAKMHTTEGLTWCMGRNVRHECFGRLDLDHIVPAGRHLPGRDKAENFQVICRALHRYKTTTPGWGGRDFRTEADKKMLREL